AARSSRALPSASRRRAGSNRLGAPIGERNLPPRLFGETPSRATVTFALPFSETVIRRNARTEELWHWMALARASLPRRGGRDERCGTELDARKEFRSVCWGSRRISSRGVCRTYGTAPGRHSLQRILPRTKQRGPSLDCQTNACAAPRTHGLERRATEPAILRKSK